MNGKGQKIIAEGKAKHKQRLETGVLVLNGYFTLSQKQMEILNKF